MKFNTRITGLVLAVAISMVLLTLFFGSVILNPGKYYFAAEGDGFKSYYVALFHTQRDRLPMRSDAMNYPFGEMISFTDSQPVVTQAIRFISSEFYDISPYTTGIINLTMLLSVLLGVVFLYLILSESGVGWWYASMVSVGIAFLSPQIGRLGGHFSLAWVLWIPLMIWLIIRFDKSRWLIFSILIGITTFLSGLMQFYYIAFFAFLIGGYWIFRFLFYNKASTIWYRDMLHIFFQFILPVLLLQLLVLLNDDVTDRTAFPFGYERSVAHPLGVFLPSGSPWSFIPGIFTVFRHISWESLAFIGSVSLAAFFVGFYQLVRRVIRKRPFHRVTPNRSLNVLFWASIMALLFSFGIPFILGLDGLYDLFPLLRQFRVLARFSWLFFYLMNIVVFVSIYHKAFVSPSGKVWKTIAVAALLLLGFEAFYNTRGIAVQLQNRIPELEDWQNETQENQWVKKIIARDYQAIIPVPYFHVGSENIWIDNGPEIKKAVMVASLKTGLPTTGVDLSRTSLSQTFLNYSLYTEPLQRLELVDYLPDERAFLVMVMKDYEPTETEKWVLIGAKPLLETSRFALMSLPVAHIRRLHETWRRKTIEDFSGSRFFDREGWLVSDSVAFFRHLSYDTLHAKSSFRGKGAFTFPAQKRALAFNDTLENVPKGRKMVAGFWIRPYQKDACLRTNLEIKQLNSDTGGTAGWESDELFRHIKAFYGEWALVEMEFETRIDHPCVQIFLQNKVVPGGEFIIDELLIREKGLEVWMDTGNTLYHNGRKFSRRKLRAYN